MSAKYVAGKLCISPECAAVGFEHLRESERQERARLLKVQEDYPEWERIRDELVEKIGPNGFVSAHDVTVEQERRQRERATMQAG
jgi:hypothetical protein